MKTLIIVGSQRKKSESRRVADFIGNILVETGSEVSVLDLGSEPLPLWNEEVWDKTPEWENILSPVREKLKWAEAFVVVSPEYSGMVPGGLKNFFLFAGQRDVGHKPGLLVSVSSGRGGSYPIAELRMSSYKNTKICYIPEHIIVRDCENMFVGKEPASDIDDYLRRRTRFAIGVLQEYSEALKSVRESGKVFVKEFANGL